MITGIKVELARVWIEIELTQVGIEVELVRLWIQVGLGLVANHLQLTKYT